MRLFQGHQCLLTLVLVSLVVGTCHAFTTGPSDVGKWRRRCVGGSTTCSSLNMAVNPQQRENEIRRKIMKLKRQGRIQKSDSSADVDKMQRPKSTASEDYSQKLKQKLGRKKASMMGLTSEDDDDDDDDEYDDIQADLDSYDDDEEEEEERRAQLGPLPARTDASDDEVDVDVTTESYMAAPKSDASSSSSTAPSKPIINPDLFDFEGEEEEEQDEEDLIELVAQKLKEKRQQEQEQEEKERQERLDALYQQRQGEQQTPQQTTSGVGGTWIKTNATSPQNVETYQPKTGSWGAFPRPKDISKAYGGGRRVGAGFDESQLVASQQDTRERLRQYREKVGIEVQSEKVHADEIDEALRLGGYAMQVSVCYVSCDDRG